MNKINICEIYKSSHSVFIYVLHSVWDFLKLGLYLTPENTIIYIKVQMLWTREVVVKALHITDFFVIVQIVKYTI